MKDLFLSILKEKKEYYRDTGVIIEPKPGGLKRISLDDDDSETTVIVPERDIGKGALNDELKRKIGERSGGKFDREQALRIVNTLSDRKYRQEKKQRQEPFQRQFGKENNE